MTFKIRLYNNYYNKPFFNQSTNSLRLKYHVNKRLFRNINMDIFLNCLQTDLTCILNINM